MGTELAGGALIGIFFSSSRMINMEAHLEHRIIILVVHAKIEILY